MAVPGATVAAALEFSRRHWLLLVRFGATSAGRAASAIAVILLIERFLSGVLGEGQGRAADLAQTLGTIQALWLVAGALLATNVWSG
jgi:hypothetical protein